MLSQIAVYLSVLALPVGSAEEFPQGQNVARMKMTLASRAKLELLVNNLTEVFMTPFGPNGPSDAQKIDFAKSHEVRNAKTLANPHWVSKARADELCVRYFGAGIRAHKVDGAKGYRVEWGDGEAGSYGFLNSVTRTGRDQLRLEVWTYTTVAGSGPDYPELAKMSKFPMLEDYMAERGKTYTAVVQRIEGKSPRYIVKSWR